MQNDLKQCTKLFALRIIKTFAALPKTQECRVLGKQVLRSGTSVGANYREAAASRSVAEFIAKLGDCHKELEEPSGARQTARMCCPQGGRGGAHQTQYWLELLIESGCVSSDRLGALRQEAAELTAIIVTSIKSVKKMQK